MDEPKQPTDFVHKRKDAARILGVCLKTLERMEKRGEAPPRVRISPRVTGYRDSALTEFLKSREAA